MILGIYGASGLGSEFLDMVLSINENEKRWDEIIYIDDTPGKSGSLFMNKRIIDYQELGLYDKKNVEIVIAMGEPQSRNAVYKKIIDDGYAATNLVYPGNRMPCEIQLGTGVVFQRNVQIPPFGKIGDNVLIRDSVFLGHNVSIGNNTVISPFSFVGGNTEIGANAYIAPHTSIRDRVTIGNGTIIGIGSVVTKNIPDFAVAYGNPCEIKRINAGEKVWK